MTSAAWPATGIAFTLDFFLANPVLKMWSSCGYAQWYCRWAVHVNSSPVINHMGT